MDCICDSRELFIFGCRCGAFDFEVTHHVWFNGIIYSIARNPDEATLLARQYLGEFEDFDEEWLKGDGWEIINDEDSLPLFIEEESDDEEIRTAAEWVEYYGPGFLAAV